MLVGLRSLGVQRKLSRPNGVLHHGHALIGAGARFPNCRNFRTRVTALSSPVSFTPPSRFGDASPPTHSPISIGQSPSSFCPFSFVNFGSVRISSKAHTTPAARDS